LIEELKKAKELEPEFGTGFSRRQLERSRQFYREYPIASALRSQFNWFRYLTFIAIFYKMKNEYYGYEKATKVATYEI